MLCLDVLGVKSALLLQHRSLNKESRADPVVAGLGRPDGSMALSPAVCLYCQQSSTLVKGDDYEKGRTLSQKPGRCCIQSATARLFLSAILVANVRL